MKSPVRGPALFALAFRPFFLLAGLAAVALVAVWIAVHAGTGLARSYYGAIGWHAHEMLFGYAVAVLGGFLLTAARNWTGVQTVHGAPLAGLAALWLAGRVVAVVPALPGWLIAAVDVALLPALCVAVAIPIVRVRQTRNMVFIALLGVLAVANLLVHVEALGVLAGGGRLGLYLAVYTFVLVIAVMGGRVIPFFTERGLLDEVRCRRWPAVEWAAPASVVAVAACDLWLPGSRVVLPALAALAAAVHLVRVAGWYTPRYWRAPLLWVLHLGYAWIAVGFALRAAAGVGLLAPSIGLHAFTAGAIGVLTLGMMARVALGHSGRPLHVGADMVAAFALANLAAAVRVLLPPLLPGHYAELIVVSGLLWCAAFTIFVARYAPILARPRADGRPG